MSQRLHVPMVGGKPLRTDRSAAPEAPLFLAFSEGRTVKTLLGITAFLLLAGTLSVLAESMPKFLGRDLFTGLFNLNDESNVPATFTALILLAAALILGVIAWAKRQSRSEEALAWKALTIIFGYLALDEAAQLHERLTSIIRKTTEVTGILHHAWVIPYGILALIVALSFLRFLTHLPSKIRWRVVLAGAIYVFGALGFEMIEGVIVTTLSEDSLLNRLTIVVEEGMEMLGVTLFIGALLSYISSYLPHLKLHLGVGSGPATGQQGGSD
ncbi:hypothetical protein [Deinococcus frigens]|uniref:hypothetical protein n=1 Tax=Deinococcus frigens TaxID=249403 RepID=UPI0012EB269E|nr:hypothetical protein [Deinococcus frigens]